MSQFKRSDRKVDTIQHIPVGRYWLACVSAEDQQTKAGNGWYVNAQFKVVRGDHTNRRIWHRFTTENMSEIAVAIGQEQLTLWAMACGKPESENTDDLIGVEFDSYIGTERNSENRRIASFYLNGNQLRFEDRPVQQPAWSNNGGGAQPAPARKSLPDDDIPF